MVATAECAEKSKAVAGNRVSKPLMEKKRRARINKSLDQLKSLLESYYSSNIRKRKLEKADILELTVKHLRNLQKIQSCPAAAASELSEYQFGFRGCLAHVSQYLLMADGLSGSDRWMLSQLSSKLCRAASSSTMDSAPGDAAPEDRTSDKPKVTRHRSTRSSRVLRSDDAQRSSQSKQTEFAAASAQNPDGKSAICKTSRAASHGNEDANAQHSVWRPW